MVGGVLLAGRVSADPWSRGCERLDLHCIVVSANGDLAKLISWRRRRRSYEWPLHQATTPTMVPGGRARALQAVDGAPKEEAEIVLAVGHGDVPEAAAGHVPCQSAGGGVPPVSQMGQRWAKHHTLSMRRRSNLKNKSTDERLPQIWPFLRNHRKMMNEPAQRKGHAFSDTEAGVRAAQPRDPKYGRFQLNERFNSDQVPSRKRGSQREVSASPSRSLSVSWKRSSARSNLP